MTNIAHIREMKARITVFGVGGAGGNAVNNMIAAGLQGVDFVVANTDAQTLSRSKAKQIIQMGTGVTQGLGAGSQPEIGRAAAEEVINAIRDHLTGAHMVFVTRPADLHARNPHRALNALRALRTSRRPPII
jgi:cell division protein FtsZ